MKTNLGVLLLCQMLFVLLFSLQTRAQSTSSFVSAADQDLTVKTVTAVPFTDNIKGIYAQPLYKKFQDLISNEKLWSYEALPDSTQAPLDLDENPNAVKGLLNTAKAQGLFSFRITKGPKGLNGRLTFFAGTSGFPLLQEELVDYPGFEIADLEKQLEGMYEKIKARLPYRGMILSRRGQEVTINLGFKTGVKNNDEISVIQILKVNRHPKLKFMVSTEKEILGKIKIFKTDEYLSFAYVTYEREPGTLQTGMKLLPLDFVRYNEPVVANGKVVPGLENRKDRDLSYGDNPQEWLPQQAPQYGRIALLAGIGNYSMSTNLSASGSIEASTSMAPEIAIKGELWLSSEWNVLYNIRQSVFSVSNPLAGATPATLNMSLSSYGVSGAYNFLMSEDFFGPKLQLSAGYATYNSHSDQSTPLAFTNMNYGGLVFGVLGQFPLSQEIPMDLGAQFNLFLSPSMSESTASGDSSDSTINQFGFFGVYHLKSRFKIRGEINFEYYSTDFSGTGSGTHTSSNTTQKITSFMGGIEYLF
ncbi:hypothetical protein [Bdellovibrio sp. HCB337]|uniref:hypothetical protein n=1 Tax=Bdellovibrio sp. HCB337 TaxID=3394358 RepID=UPI0039A4D6F6